MKKRKRVQQEQRRWEQMLRRAGVVITPFPANGDTSGLVDVRIGPEDDDCPICRAAREGKLGSVGARAREN